MISRPTTILHELLYGEYTNSLTTKVGLRQPDNKSRDKVTKIQIKRNVSTKKTGRIRKLKRITIWCKQERKIIIKLKRITTCCKQEINREVQVQVLRRYTTTNSSSGELALCTRSNISLWRLLGLELI